MEPFSPGEGGVISDTNPEPVVNPDLLVTGLVSPPASGTGSSHEQEALPPRAQAVLRPAISDFNPDMQPLAGRRDTVFEPSSLIARLGMTQNLAPLPDNLIGISREAIERENARRAPLLAELRRLEREAAALNVAFSVGQFGNEEFQNFGATGNNPRNVFSQQMRPRSVLPIYLPPIVFIEVDEVLRNLTSGSKEIELLIKRYLMDDISKLSERTAVGLSYINFRVNILPEMLLTARLWPVFCAIMSGADHMLRGTPASITSLKAYIYNIVKNLMSGNAGNANLIRVISTSSGSLVTFMKNMDARYGYIADENELHNLRQELLTRKFDEQKESLNTYGDRMVLDVGFLNNIIIKLNLSTHIVEITDNEQIRTMYNLLLPDLKTLMKPRLQETAGTEQVITIYQFMAALEGDMETLKATHLQMDSYLDSRERARNHSGAPSSGGPSREINVDSAFYSSGPSYGPSQGNSVKKGKCHNCGKEGHFARDCRAAPRQNNNGNTSSGDRGGGSQGQTRETFTQGQGQSRGYQGPAEKFIQGFIDPRSRMYQHFGDRGGHTNSGPSRQDFRAQGNGSRSDFQPQQQNAQPAQQQGQITNGSAAGPRCKWPGCGKNDHDMMDCPKMAQHALARQRQAAAGSSMATETGPRQSEGSRALGPSHAARLASVPELPLSASDFTSEYFTLDNPGDHHALVAISDVIAPCTIFENLEGQIVVTSGTKPTVPLHLSFGKCLIETVNQVTGTFYDSPTNTLIIRESKYISATLHAVWMTPGMSFFFSERAIHTDFPKFDYTSDGPNWGLILNPESAKKVHITIGKVYMKIKQSLELLKLESMRDKIHKIYDNCYLTPRKGVNGFDLEIQEQLINWKPFQDFDVNTFMETVTTISDLLIVMDALRETNLGPTNRLGAIAYLLTLEKPFPIQLIRLKDNALIITDVIGREFKGMDILLGMVEDKYYPYITDLCYLSYRHSDEEYDTKFHLLDELRSDRADFGVLWTPLMTQDYNCVLNSGSSAVNAGLLQLSTISGVWNIPKQVNTPTTFITWPSFEGIKPFKHLLDTFAPRRLSQFMINSVSELWTTCEAQFTDDFLHNVYENEMPSLMSELDSAKLAAQMMASRPNSPKFKYYHDDDVMPSLISHPVEKKGGPRTMQVWRPKAPKAS